MSVYAEREFPFTDTDFDCIRTLVNQHTGIVLSDAKRDLVYGRLTKRLRQLRLDSFRAYCQMLQTGDPGELEQLVNAITTNLTMSSERHTILTRWPRRSCRPSCTARRLRVASAYGQRAARLGKSPILLPWCARQSSQTRRRGT